MKTLDAYECEGQISLMDDSGNIKQLLPGSMPTLETRAEANESVDREKRYAQIIEILTEHPKGRTAKEIAVIMHAERLIPTSERNFTAPRLTELCRKGIVEPCGKKMCIYTCKTVTVYRLRKREGKA